MKLSPTLPLIARVAAVASLVAIALFATAGDLDLGRLAGVEWLLFLFFPVGVAAGLAIGLVRPGRGGLIALVSIVAFYLVHRLDGGAWPKGPAFLILSSPALLLLLCARTRRDR